MWMASSVYLTPHNYYTLIVDTFLPWQERKRVKARTHRCCVKVDIAVGSSQNIQDKEGRHHDVQGELGLCLCLQMCLSAELLLCQIAGRAALRALSCSCPHVSSGSQSMFHFKAWAGGCASTAPGQGALRFSTLTCGQPCTHSTSALGALPQQPMSAASSTGTCCFVDMSAQL